MYHDYADALIFFGLFDSTTQQLLEGLQKEAISKGEDARTPPVLSLHLHFSLLPGNAH